MKIFGRKEKRSLQKQVEVEDALLKAMLGSNEMDKEKALQIPSVAGTISLIGEIIASTPIKLYVETVGEDGVKKTDEVKGDRRVTLLNESTGDTLSANEMWRAIIEDYFLGKGGYIYINKERGEVKSLHFVEEQYVTIQKNTDPIFKDYDILVQGNTYKPFDFVKILRNTKDGASGKSIIEQNNLILSGMYNSLVFEDNLVRKGGNKKGFLESSKHLTDDAIKTVKEAWKRMYSNNSDNVVVLNDGMTFHESSNSSVEMQLDQSKSTNAAELGKIFHTSPNLLNGTSQSIKPSEEIKKFVKIAIIPLMNVITAALNEDLLLEREKKDHYFAYDTRELLKGDAKERFETYKAGIDSKVLMIDEARYQEDMPPLGLDMINLGLGSVLYNPKTKEVFTPNTGQTANLNNFKMKEGEENENRNQE